MQLLVNSGRPAPWATVGAHFCCHAFACSATAAAVAAAYRPQQPLPIIPSQLSKVQQRDANAELHSVDVIPLLQACFEAQPEAHSIVYLSGEQDKRCCQNPNCSSTSAHQVFVACWRVLVLSVGHTLCTASSQQCRPNQLSAGLIGLLGPL